MKKYLLFCGDKYYPGGGWRDFQGDFDSFDEVKDYLANTTMAFDWYHVVDTDTKFAVDLKKI